MNELEVQHIEDALIQFAKTQVVEPPVQIHQQILRKIRELNAHKANHVSYDLENLPLLTLDANWLAWQETVKNIHLLEEYENIHLHSLESNDTHELFLAFVKEFVPEKVHYDVASQNFKKITSLTQKNSFAAKSDDIKIVLSYTLYYLKKSLSAIILFLTH